MREINKIAEGLFEKIRDRFEDVSLGNDTANATQNPEDARFFNFDYVVDGHNHGNVTLSIVDETSLKVYFSKNISHGLDDDARKEWYSFLKELREFAKRNLLSFEPRDITRSTLKHRDIQQVSKADSTYDKDEVIGESRLYGTSRSSYENDGPVRIIIRHNGIVDTEKRGDRSRKIRAIYLENADGERLRLPHNSLRYARAMARHCAEGGSLNDEFGQHITKIAEECNKLKPFKASMLRRVFEDEETQRMVEAAFEYHSLLKDTLNKISGPKGYTRCKEQFVATSTSYIPEEEIDVDSLKERFVKRTYNERMEDALPIVHKAYEMKKSNKFAESFESWANDIAEGSWELPETDDDIDKLLELMAEPLEAGVDGENASSALYNLIGDDQLFDELYTLAKEQGPEVDVRETVFKWLKSTHPDIAEKINQSMDPVQESSTGDTPFAHMSRSELLDYLNLDTLVAQHISNEKLRTKAEEKSQDMTEGNTYGSGDGGMDGTVEEAKDKVTYDPKTGKLTGWEHEGDWKKSTGKDPVGKIHNLSDKARRETEKMAKDTVKEDDEDLLANTEAIQSAIIRRILHNINDHSELLKKAGPDGVMNAASDVASFHAPMEEIGSSDVSIMVREVYREVGMDYPEMNEGIVDTIRGMNYKRLADRSFNKAMNAQDDTMKYGLADRRRGKHEKEFNKQMDKMRQRTDKAKSLGVDESKMSDMDIDVSELTDQEFLEKYNHTKQQAIDGDWENHYESEPTDESIGDDYVNKDEKLKRMGAKDLNFLDKLKTIPHGIKAIAKDEPEDDVSLYNKQFNEDIEQMRKIAGLK